MKNNHCVFCGEIERIKTVDIEDARGNYEVTDLVLCITRTIKGVEKTTMVPIEAWGDASALAKEFEVGERVIVKGHFENKKWQNKNKQDRSKNVIVLENIEEANV